MQKDDNKGDQQAPVHASSPSALSALRVLDLSTGIAGGYCTKLLADYGAQVVKVETPGEGDPLRQWGPFPHDAPDAERGLLHWYLNANKRGITLDVTSTAGRDILQRLLPQFDVVVESLPPSRARELGVTYKTVRGDRTDLIWLSLPPSLSTKTATTRSADENEL